jgi:hypothetical protein
LFLQKVDFYIKQNAFCKMFILSEEEEGI